jgi:hypothetical protein
MSAGLTAPQTDWFTAIRIKAIGKNFDISEVGYVPWVGTAEFVGVTGPVWFYETGPLRRTMIYAGGSLWYDDADLYTDHSLVAGVNMNFRREWGFENTWILGKSKDLDKRYVSYEVDLSTWFHISPRWQGNLYGSYARTYNFSRDYLAYYSSLGMEMEWKPFTTLEVGTTYNMYVEYAPDRTVEDVTYNARPFCSFTPMNNLNVRVYVDNVYIASLDRLDQVIGGLLISFNFLPKSWVYLAVNEAMDRSDALDAAGGLLPRRMHTTSRAGVLKAKYLYYF